MPELSYFAQVDENNIVHQIHVVENSSMIDPDTGQVNPQIGIDYLMSVLPEGSPIVNYIQTSLDGSINYRYAYSGGFYDAENEVFVDPQPWPEFIYTGEPPYEWVPPIPPPPTPPPQGNCTYEYEWSQDQYVATGDGWYLVAYCTPVTPAPPVPPPQGNCYYEYVWDQEQYEETGDGWKLLEFCDDVPVD